MNEVVVRKHYTCSQLALLIVFFYFSIIKIHQANTAGHPRWEDPTKEVSTISLALAHSHFLSLLLALSLALLLSLSLALALIHTHRAVS